MTGHPVQERIWQLEDAEHAARELRDRALDLALRLTASPGQGLPPLARRAIWLALSLHHRAEQAADQLDDFLNYLEGGPR
ncbi:hypothetical protein ABT173_03400 [Streptomyces sp. NPDC001795]|uniref:hypothetical protein n=1 Tax=Streptomyces sp. NPDC001795 TaxID=3154525 RepID=UPI00332A0BEC